MPRGYHYQRAMSPLNPGIPGTVVWMNRYFWLTVLSSFGASIALSTVAILRKIS
jgi:hypothetical protein